MGGVGDDLPGEFELVLLVAGVFPGGFGKVERGDLKAVEEEAGTAGVDLVAGDALEDLADAELDGGAVFGEGEVEYTLGGGFGGRSGRGAGEGLAGFVVVVTELLAAEGLGAAAAAVGEEVAALVGFG